MPLTIAHINYIARAARDAYGRVKDTHSPPVLASSHDADETAVDDAWIAACVDFGLMWHQTDNPSDELQEAMQAPDARIMAAIGAALLPELEAEDLDNFPDDLPTEGP